MTDPGAEDSSDEPQMEVCPEQETEELSDCDGESEDDDSVNCNEINKVYLQTTRTYQRVVRVCILYHRNSFCIFC